MIYKYRKMKLLKSEPLHISYHKRVLHLWSTNTDFLFQMLYQNNSPSFHSTLEEVFLRCLLVHLLLLRHYCKKNIPPVQISHNSRKEMQSMNIWEILSP